MRKSFHMITEEEKKIKHIGKKEFREIYDLYFNALCSFAYRYIQDITSVEDMVQESFIGFWGKKNDLNNYSAIKSFLYTSVRNKCLNALAHNKVEQKHEKNLVYELESEQYFQNHIIEEETFNNLYNEIKNLPESSREIMLLALNGLKNPEIAEELNISVNTVKTQKKIAYGKLKTKLKPVEYSFLLTL